MCCHSHGDASGAEVGWTIVQKTVTKRKPSNAPSGICIARERCDILLSQSLYQQHDALLSFLEAFQGNVLQIIDSLEAVLCAGLAHLLTHIIFMGLFCHSSFALESASEPWPQLLKHLAQDRIQERDMLSG